MTGHVVELYNCSTSTILFTYSQHRSDTTSKVLPPRLSSQVRLKFWWRKFNIKYHPKYSKAFIS